MATFSRNPARQYIDAIDERLKKRRGSATLTGSEVQGGFVLPEGRKFNFQPSLTGLSSTPDYPVTNVLPAETPVNGQFLGATDVDGRAVSSSEDFVKTLWGQIAQKNQPIGSTQDGGTYYSNGTIKYSDGTIRQGDPNAYPVRTNEDGSVGYSDGSSRYQDAQVVAQISPYKVLMSDGTVRWGANGQAGLEGLINGVFGQERTITQPYGNINPIEPTPGNVNLGTDIRTRDLSGTARNLFLPMDTEVVQVLYDDGTRFGDRSGHQGYGNSVLLRLPSGEMLRFSHLSQMGQFQVGDVIKAGEVFGTPGETGNAYGEHLDLEYYNQNGQIDNPNNFIGFVDEGAVGINPTDRIASDESLTQSEREQKQRLEGQMRGVREGRIPASMIGVENPNKPQILGAETQMQTTGRRPLPAIEETNMLARGTAYAGQMLNAPELNISETLETPSRENISRIPEKAAQSVGINRDYQLGEALRGETGITQPIANVFEDFGRNTGMQEYNVGETIRNFDVSDALGSVRQKADNMIASFGNEITKPFQPQPAYAGSGEGLSNTQITKPQNDVLQNIATKQAVQGVASNIDGSIKTTQGNVLPIASMVDGATAVIPDGDGDVSRSSSSASTFSRVEPSKTSSKSSSSKSSSKSSSSKSSSSSSKSSSSSTKIPASSATNPKASNYKIPASSISNSKASNYKIPGSSTTNSKAANYKPSTPAKSTPKQSTFSKAVSKVISFFTKK